MKDGDVVFKQDNRIVYYHNGMYFACNTFGEIKAENLKSFHCKDDAIEFSLSNENKEIY